MTISRLARLLLLVPRPDAGGARRGRPPENLVLAQRPRVAAASGVGIAAGGADGDDLWPERREPPSPEKRVVDAAVAGGRHHGDAGGERPGRWPTAAPVTPSAW